MLCSLSDTGPASSSPGETLGWRTCLTSGWQHRIFVFAFSSHPSPLHCVFVLQISLHLRMLLSIADVSLFPPVILSLIIFNLCHSSLLYTLSGSLALVFSSLVCLRELVKGRMQAMHEMRLGGRPPWCHACKCCNCSLVTLWDRTNSRHIWVGGHLLFKRNQFLIKTSAKTCSW